MYKNIIFDMDGVILDTEPIYYTVEGELVAEYSNHRHSKHDIAKLTPQLLGRTALDSVEIVLEYFQLQDVVSVQEFYRERSKRLQIKMRNVPLVEGVKEFVQDMAKMDIKMAVATSTSRDLLWTKLGKHKEFIKHFQCIICADDVQHGKPAPDIFLKAADQLRVDYASCVVFEDAIAGVKAGKTAGMDCVAIRNPHVDPSEYYKVGASQVVDSFDQVDRKALGLPLVVKEKEKEKVKVKVDFNP